MKRTGFFFIACLMIAVAAFGQNRIPMSWSQVVTNTTAITTTTLRTSNAQDGYLSAIQVYQTSIAYIATNDGDCVPGIPTTGYIFSTTNNNGMIYDTTNYYESTDGAWLFWFKSATTNWWISKVAGTTNSTSWKKVDAGTTITGKYTNYSANATGCVYVASTTPTLSMNVWIEPKDTNMNRTALVLTDVGGSLVYYPRATACSNETLQAWFVDVPLIGEKVAVQPYDATARYIKCDVNLYITPF